MMDLGILRADRTYGSGGRIDSGENASGREPGYRPTAPDNEARGCPSAVPMWARDERKSARHTRRAEPGGRRCDAVDTGTARPTGGVDALELPS